MVKKIALGAVIAVLLLGGEALLAEKPEAKTPPCEVKANAGCPLAKAAAVNPQRGPRPQMAPGRAGGHGPMGGFGFGLQQGKSGQGSHPQLRQILSRIAQVRRRFGQRGQGPGGPAKGAPGKIGKPGCPKCAPGKACDGCKAWRGPGRGIGGHGRGFGGFGFGFGRAFGGLSRGGGPGRSMGFMGGRGRSMGFMGRSGRSMGFMRGPGGSGFGAAMRMRGRGASRGRVGTHGRGSRSRIGDGPTRRGPGRGMWGSHRGGRGPQRGDRGPSRSYHGRRRGGRDRESREHHGRGHGDRD